MDTPLPRPIIHCPQCHRELFNLHHPWCLWCGAAVSPEQFEVVAQHHSSEEPASQQSPLLMPPTYGAASFGMGMFRRLNPMAVRGAASPCERKLRITGVALALCFVAAKLAETLWPLWRIH